MILRFQPANMNILPLYIVLLLGFPLALWLLLRRPTLALGASAALYVAVRVFGLRLATYPDGTWFFNPLAWQLLFVFGAWCALGGVARLGRLIQSRGPALVALAIAYLVFAFVLSFVWNFSTIEVKVPRWLSNWIFAIDKTRLDPERFIHFAALAVVTVQFVRRDWPGLESRWLRPVILCGQHSLVVFCLGEFLSFAGHFVITEAGGNLATHVLVSVSGIFIMVGVALLLTWYRRTESRSRAARTAPANVTEGQGVGVDRHAMDRQLPIGDEIFLDHIAHFVPDREAARAAQRFVALRALRRRRFRSRSILIRRAGRQA